MFSMSKCFIAALYTLSLTNDFVPVVATTGIGNDNPPQQWRRLTKQDEARAYMPVPPHGSALLSSNREELPTLFNDWLFDNFPESKLKSCEDFQDVHELNDILTQILELKHPDLQKIYKRHCDIEEGRPCDNRALKWDTVQEYQKDWEEENLELHVFENHDSGTLMQEIAIKGKCSRAVMWFQHHLSADSRQALMDREGFVLPLMAENSFEAFEQWTNHLDDIDKNGNDDDGQRKLYKRFTENPFDGDGPMNCANCHLNNP